MKSLCKNNRICDLQIANSNPNIIENYVRISLDLIPDVRNFLKENINPLEVIAYLESLYNVRITPHDTLIILDEIQDCKRALLALKYFQEEYPQYDIVAAGSLLGVAVNKGEKEQQPLFLFRSLLQVLVLSKVIDKVAGT